MIILCIEIRANGMGGIEPSQSMVGGSIGQYRTPRLTEDRLRSDVTTDRRIPPFRPMMEEDDDLITKHRIGFQPR